MKCTNCNLNNSVNDPVYGTLPCQECRNKQAVKPKQAIEITTKEIVESRLEFDKDIVQPFRDGIFSKEYYEKNGTSGVTVSQNDLKNMKNVWGGTEGHYYNE